MTTPVFSGSSSQSSNGLPLLVDWDSKDDPQNPQNWPKSKKWLTVFLVSLLTLISPFGSSMFAPSTGDAMSEFNQSNVDLESFSVSIFVLGYAFGPLLHAPMSELYGRLVVYHVNSFLFIVFNIGCALSVNLPVLIVFRLLTGLVGSCPLAIGPASVADCFPQEERGKAIALWNLPVLLGPALGPLVGSYLSTATNWRWTFWFLVIAMGAIYLTTLVCLRESHAPTILERKARKLRKIHGNPAIASAHQSTKPSPAAFLPAIVRPSKMLFTSPIVFVLSLTAAVNYGFIYIIFTTMTSVFMERYNMASNTVGLTYLAFGIGNIIGNVALGVLSDRLMKHMAGAGEMKPEYRLPPLLPGSLLVPMGLLLYGWTLEYNVHWIVPLIGMVIVGLGTIFVFVPINTYLIDAFTTHAASATAASTVLRSLGGGLLPLCGGRLYQAVGDGWGNSILAFLGIAFIPAVWLIYIRGERLRNGFHVKL